MKKILLTFCSIAVVIGIVSVFVIINRWGHNIKPPKNSYKFAIYIARYGGNGDGKYVVDNEPVVTEKDIAKYHWEDHEIELTENFLTEHKPTFHAGSSIDYRGGSKLLATGFMDKAIIVVNGKKIYETVFQENDAVSFGPTGPYEIRDVSTGKSIYVKSYIDNPKKDKRYDSSLYKVVKELGVLVE